MTTTEKKSSNYREDYPGYQGFIPYKYSIIGKNIGATNETIKSLLTDEPPQEASLKSSQCQDFSHYNRDYYCDSFDRSYPLEEETVFSNRSKDAKTWICSDKYKIYPQHIPKMECHVPGIYSANIYGKGFSRSSAIAIKDDYNKGLDCSVEERYKTTNNDAYAKPKIRSKDDLNLGIKTESIIFGKKNDINKSVDNIYRIYHTKIAKVPTVGYTGASNESLFQKQIGYLNYDKILQKERIIKQGPGAASYAGLPEKFQKSLKIVTEDDDCPFISGYKGYKAGIKANNLYGASTHNLALQARNEMKMKNVF